MPWALLETPVSPALRRPLRELPLQPVLQLDYLIHTLCGRIHAAFRENRPRSPFGLGISLATSSLSSEP